MSVVEGSDTLRSQLDIVKDAFVLIFINCWSSAIELGLVLWRRWDSNCDHNHGNTAKQQLVVWPLQHGLAFSQMDIS